MLETDPPQPPRAPEHLQQAVQRGAASARTRSSSANVAREVLDRALDQGGVRLRPADRARSSRSGSCARIFTVPQEDAPMCVSWGDAMIGNQATPSSRAPSSTRRTPRSTATSPSAPRRARDVRVRATVAEQRLGEPQDDLITELDLAERDGERLSEREFDNYFCLLMIAGNETTRHTITHGMRALIDHPDQMQMLRDDPRWLMQRPSRRSCGGRRRRCTSDGPRSRDTELRGQTIREGDKVVIWYIEREPRRGGVRGPLPLRHHAIRAPATMSRSGRAGRISAWARTSRSSRRGSCSRSSSPTGADRAHRAGGADALELRERHQAHAGSGRARR